MSSISRKLSKSLVSLLVTFLLLEALVRVANVEGRIFGDPSGKQYTLLTFLVPDPYLQWRGRPWMPTVRDEDTLNSRGWRAPEYRLEKPPGVKRVAVLGDSCTFGVVTLEPGNFAMPRPYPALVQDRLDATLGPGKEDPASSGYFSGADIAHPTAAGHARIAGVLQEALRGLLDGEEGGGPS